MSKSDFITLSKIGTGAFSTVYKVRRIKDNSIYAMKEIKLGNLSKDEKESALNECRLLASVDSNYVCKQYESFFDDRTRILYIIMELADHGDLFKKIENNKRNRTQTTEKEIWSIFTQICKALRDLHKKRILHRDIKSANIFVDKENNIKIGDLNVSKVSKTGLATTQTGTPYYCPPEIWENKKYDSKCDIWSLGIVLYELCTLEPPFRANDLKGMYNKIKRGVYSPLPSMYSRELTNVVKRLLSVRPSERPSADEILCYQIPVKNDFMKTLGRRNSNPDLLCTIKVPQKLNLLQNMLPKAKYKKDINDDIKLFPKLNNDQGIKEINLNQNKNQNNLRKQMDDIYNKENKENNAPKRNINNNPNILGNRQNNKQNALVNNNNYRYVRNNLW